MIHVLGNGDLSKEFISFSDFGSKNVKIYDSSNFFQAEFSGKDFINSICKDDKVFITISDPHIRKKVFQYIISIGLTPDTYIHPSVIIGQRTKIGVGCIIQPNTIISNDVLIKNSVFINCNTFIGHDVIVGNYCSFMVNVNTGGHCKIDECVLLGTGVILLPKVKILSNMKIGIGSVVTRDIVKQGSYFGNPAKLIF